MHCPRCGQQQVSEEIKFCSRCGFPLGLVSEILAHGGFLPQLANLHRDRKLFTRKNGVKFGLVWMLVWTFLITPLAAIADGEEFVAVAAVIGMMGGGILMLLSLLFLKSAPPSLEAQKLPPAVEPRKARAFAEPNAPNALPAQRSYPVADYVPAVGSWKAPDTGDLAAPGSVTESTTRLLKREE